MKIALDSQMYLVPQKTGIPWYVKRLTVSALKQNIKNDFRFDYFTQSVPGSEIENFEREFMQYGKLNRC
ncbi:MAG: hypothetical protein LBI03_05975, partial [Clostridiales bacterium]|nr:hypothetical protein [Clostridiales bacterium]